MIEELRGVALGGGTRSLWILLMKPILVAVAAEWYELAVAEAT